MTVPMAALAALLMMWPLRERVGWAQKAWPAFAAGLLPLTALLASAVLRRPWLSRLALQLFARRPTLIVPFLHYLNNPGSGSPLP